LAQHTWNWKKPMIPVNGKRTQRDRQKNHRGQGAVLVCYIALSAIGHLVWELIQLPYYSIWNSGTTEQLIVAIVHCTIGDVMIAVSVLMVSVVLWRSFSWPRSRYWYVAITAVFLGVVYTGFSEWLNVYVRQSWLYDSSMPVLKILEYDIGLSPLAQWIIIPGLVFFALDRWREINVVAMGERRQAE